MSRMSKNGKRVESGCPQEKRARMGHNSRKNRQKRKRERGCPHGCGEFCPICLATQPYSPPAISKKTVKPGDTVMFEGSRLSDDQVDAIATILGPERLFFLTGTAGSG